MADDSKKYPEFSQRDPLKPHNQLRPLSTRTSGTELDEVCGSGIEQAGAGVGLDEAARKLDEK